MRAARRLNHPRAFPAWRAWAGLQLVKRRDFVSFQATALPCCCIVMGACTNSAGRAAPIRASDACLSGCRPAWAAAICGGMAVRHVRGVARDRSGTTVTVCLREPGGPLVLVGEVIEDIRVGRHDYVVDAGGRVGQLVLVHGPSGFYLRTSADRDRTNNLDSLPDCDDLPPMDAQPVRRNAATVSADERRPCVARSWS